MIERLQNTGWDVIRNENALRLERRFSFNSGSEADRFAAGIGACMSLPRLSVVVTRVPKRPMVEVTMLLRPESVLEDAASAMAETFENHYRARDLTAA